VVTTTTAPDRWSVELLATGHDAAAIAAQLQIPVDQVHAALRRAGATTPEVAARLVEVYRQRAAVVAAATGHPLADRQLVDLDVDLTDHDLVGVEPTSEPTTKPATKPATEAGPPAPVIDPGLVRAWAKTAGFNLTRYRRIPAGVLALYAAAITATAPRAAAPEAMVPGGGSR